MPLTRRRAKQDFPVKGPEYWLKQNKDPPGTVIGEVSTEIGLGVFTTKCFSKGEFILEYAGELKDATQTAAAEQTYFYYFKHNGRCLCIDAILNIERRGRFINDEWQGPNSKVKKILLGNKTPKLAVFATKNIEKGSEVRFDYGDKTAPWRQKKVPKKASEQKSGFDTKLVEKAGPDDTETGHWCDEKENEAIGPSDIEEEEESGDTGKVSKEGSEREESEEVGPSDSNKDDSCDSVLVEKAGPDDIETGHWCDEKENEAIGPSDIEEEEESCESWEVSKEGPSNYEKIVGHELMNVTKEGSEREDGYDAKESEEVGPSDSNKDDSCDSVESGLVGPNDSHEDESRDLEVCEVVGPSDPEEDESCNLEERIMASAKGGGFIPPIVRYSSSSSSDSDESYVIPVMKSRRVNQIVCSASGSDQDEVSFTGCEEENYIPSFSSESEDTDDYVGEEEPAPKVCRTNNQKDKVGDSKNHKKKGQVDHILRTLQDSNHNEEGVQSWFDTDGYMRKEVEESEASVLLPSNANVCRTNNEKSSIPDKKHYTKLRTADHILGLSSDEDEEVIQRLSKRRVRKSLAKRGNNLPSSTCGSDTDNCKETDTDDDKGEKEPASTVSVPSPSGVKVCMANNKGRRVWDKKHYCVYCMKAFPKLPRHLEQVHASEKDVAEALSFSKNSKKRKLLLDLLRNKGNHAHNVEVLKSKCGFIIPAKRPTFDVPASDYLPCSQCFGYYIGRDMWKHLKFCTAKELHAEMKRGERHQARCALLLPVSRAASSAFQRNILGSMIRDEISFAARQDDMINKFGERMYSRLGHEIHQYNYISQKMRELARLLLAIRATHNYEQVTLTDVIRPEHFDKILESVHTCAGFNASTCMYKTPSLALKLGHSLRKCASILKADAIREGNTQLKMAAENFLELCEIEWTHKVSSSALATLEEKKWNKPDMLPLSEDIIKFHKYLGAVSTEAKSQLPLKCAWITLAEATLSKIILFNRRRSGEAQRIKVKEFERRNNGNINSDVIQSLTTWEQTLCSKLNRIEVKGKRGRKVPVLLTEEMTESLELLMKHRSVQGISSENVFVFARANNESQMCIRGSDCLRKLAIKCIKDPSNLTSTKLRKQIATVSQIFCLRENELDILAGFMGHDIRVHRDYYRLPENALQTAKVARILMLMEKGLVHDYKDKTLSEIEVALDDPSYDDVDNESGTEEDEEEEEEGLEEEDEKVEGGEEENANSEEEEQDMDRKEQQGKEGRKDREKLKGSRKGVWTLAEAKAIEKHFAKHIRLLKVPRKHECEECIRKNPLLANHQWKRIKFKVYSIIQRNKKY